MNLVLIKIHFTIILSIVNSNINMFLFILLIEFKVFIIFLIFKILSKNKIVSS